MADQKITQLTALTGANVSDNDVVAIVDVSPTATTKKMTRTEFFKNTPSIGIGTSSPERLLHIQRGSGAGSVTSASTYLAVLDSDSDCVLQLRTPNTDSAWIRFSDPDSFDVGSIEYNHSDDTMRFEVGTIEAIRIDSSGNVGIANTSPTEKLDVTGNVTISGSISKGSGSFRIDHPLKPDTHHLVHSFIEGPQADNLYRGKVALVAGQATVNLDEAGRMSEGTFSALNGNVQCFTTNEDGWTAVRGSVSGNILMIEAQDATCTDTVSWLVIGERHDQHMLDTTWTDDQGRIIVEPEKVVVHPDQGISEEA